MHVRSVVAHSHYYSTLPAVCNDKIQKQKHAFGATVVVFSLAHYLYFFQALDSLIDTTVMAFVVNVVGSFDVFVVGSIFFAYEYIFATIRRHHMYQYEHTQEKS